MADETQNLDYEGHENLTDKLDNESVKLETKSPQSDVYYSLVFYAEDIGEIFGSTTFGELSEIASDYEVDSIVCLSSVKGADNRIWRFDRGNVIMKSLSVFKETSPNDYRGLVDKLSKKKPEMLDKIGIDPNKLSYIS